MMGISNIERYVETFLETKYGLFSAVGYADYQDRTRPFEHVALIHGDVLASEYTPITVRVHSKCLTSEVFSSLHCDCAQQLDQAFRIVVSRKRGIIIYLDQEGRGIGLLNKLKAYHLQQTLNLDTIDANHRLGFDTDLRSYHVAAEILKDIGVSNIRLLTNNPDKIVSLEQEDIKVTTEPFTVIYPKEATSYVKTKIERLGHFDNSNLNGFRSMGSKSTVTAKILAHAKKQNNS